MSELIALVACMIAAFFGVQSYDRGKKIAMRDETIEKQENTILALRMEVSEMNP